LPPKERERERERERDRQRKKKGRMERGGRGGWKDYSISDIVYG